MTEGAHLAPCHLPDRVWQQGEQETEATRETEAAVALLLFTHNGFGM